MAKVIDLKTRRQVPDPAPFTEEDWRQRVLSALPKRALKIEDRTSGETVADDGDTRAYILEGILWSIKYWEDSQPEIPAYRTLLKQRDRDARKLQKAALKLQELAKKLINGRDDRTIVPNSHFYAHTYQLSAHVQQGIGLMQQYRDSFPASTGGRPMGSATYLVMHIQGACRYAGMRDAAIEELLTASRRCAARDARLSLDTAARVLQDPAARGHLWPHSALHRASRLGPGASEGAVGKAPRVR